MERLNLALQFGWATDLWENQEAVSGDQIKRLSNINESDVQGHLLFFALLLYSGRMEKTMYIVD